MSGRPTVAVSMGDPAGIGPEVTVAAALRPSVRRSCRLILVGDPAVWCDAAERTGARFELHTWEPGTAFPRRGLPVLEVASLRAPHRRPGRASRAGGRAAYRAILEAQQLVRQGHADALVTAPVNKANLAASGCAATGHTELLAELAGAEVRMMMVGPRLRVALCTTHLALSAVSGQLDRRSIRDTIVIANAALHRDFAIAKPRIAVAGLNPHAGESGLYGHEEIDLIRPAVSAARRRKIDVVGPIAADTAFPLMRRGDFDLVVCMYHDQALAPFKLMHFDDGVNFTAGLPYVRTSPDHGTAYDIAGRGEAQADSMIAAIRMAAHCAAARR